MSTKIYISRKLESVVNKSFINIGELEIDNPLGKWTATIFYVSHKKCLLITNSMTRYTIILDSVIAADFSDLSNIFAKILFDQLRIDGIKTDWLTIKNLVGKVDLYPTDNDRKLIGTQNNILQHTEDWKYEFGHIDNWPFREISSRLNGIPYKELEWFYPKEKIKIMLDDMNTNA